MGPFGSGKSVECCVKIATLARAQAPGPDGVRPTRWAVVRNTYPELKNTTVKTWMEWNGKSRGRFLNVAPFVHKIRDPQDDGTIVDCEVIFLALDREADAKKLLSLELTGIYYNEVREIRRSIVEAGDGRVGRYPRTIRNDDGVVIFGPSWHGVIADTNMPDEDHWIYDLDVKNGSKGWTIFKQPGGVIENADGEWVHNPLAENLHNLVEGYYTAQTDGKQHSWIKVHLGAQYGMLSPDGAYYADNIERAKKAGRVRQLIIDPSLPVHTFWDLGMDDNTTIWFGQNIAGNWNWVDFYEAHGKGLGHYAEILRQKREAGKFQYGSHIWPHDGAQRVLDDLVIPETRVEKMAKLGFNVTTLPATSIADGIDAARDLIDKSFFCSVNCAEGLAHLSRYRQKRDAKTNVYLKTPEHDEHSHAADGFRTAAMGKGQCSNGIYDSSPINYQSGGIV